MMPGWPRCTTIPLLSLLLLVPAVASAQVFISPGLEASSGYSSNRFLDQTEDGSAYQQLIPSLDVTVFAPGGLELLLGGSYSLTAYNRSGFKEVTETRGEASASAPLGAVTGTLALSAGRYEDGAVPEDDSRWVSLEPSMAWTAGEELTLLLSGSVTATRFDSGSTSDGALQQGTRWELRPTAYWFPNSALRLWGEGYGEINSSPEEAEEYTGYGGALGLDTLGRGRARAGVWLRLGRRNYRDAGGPSRRDDPRSGGLWAAYRLATWAELTAGANWADYQSTDPASDYTAWTTEIGVRFVHDWEVLSR